MNLPQSSAGVRTRPPLRARLFALKADPATLFPVAAVLLVLVVDLWFASFGLWAQWPAPYGNTYYDQLAGAFAHGSLALEQKPDPALFSLPDPYDQKARDQLNLNIPIDFSYYNGKYYLYFGPVPALALVPFKLLGVRAIGDQSLVFFFTAGIAMIQALLLTKIRRLFFPAIPAWLLGACIAFSGLVTPFAWMLTEGRVYEAAGLGGQFFLLVGFYFILGALAGDARSASGLALGGTAWALAIASRITQAVPVGLLSAMVAGWLLWRYRAPAQWPEAFRRITALALPLAVGFALLGWYNWARFGSVFETGFRYELTTPDLQGKGGPMFSAAFVLPNAYNYLLALPTRITGFPFLDVVRGRGERLFPFLTIPRNYHTRAMTGFFVSVPFIAFAVLSFFPQLSLKKEAAEQVGNRALLGWTLAALWVAFLAGSTLIMSYFWAVARFLSDFTPPGVLLSVIGFWIGYQALDRWPWPRRIYMLGAIGLMLLSLLLSNLLVFSIHATGYQTYNPALWDWLTRMPSQ